MEYFFFFENENELDLYGIKTRPRAKERKMSTYIKVCWMSAGADLGTCEVFLPPQRVRSTTPPPPLLREDLYNTAQDEGRALGFSSVTEKRGRKLDLQGPQFALASRCYLEFSRIYI